MNGISNIGKQAVFICYADKHIGFGHLSRCRCLAKEMKERGWAVTFLLPDGSQGEAGFPCFRMIKGTLEEEAQQAAQYLQDRQAVCVVDRQPLSEGYLNILKPVCRMTINLNAAYRGIDPSDMIVRGDIGEQAESKVLAGPQYKLLGADFDPSQSMDFKRPTVIMSFGGSDPSGIATVCAGAFCAQGFDAKLFLGKGDEKVLASRKGLEVIRDEKNLGMYFPQAAAAVVSAGITLYEALVCGVPCLVVPQNEEQRKEAEKMEAEGMIALTTKETLGSDMALFLGDKERWNAIRQRVKGMVDCKAPMRIADRIEAQCQEADCGR